MTERGVVVVEVEVVEVEVVEVEVGVVAKEATYPIS